MLFLELPLTLCVPADKSLSCSVPHFPHPEIAALALCKLFPSVVCVGIRGKTSQGHCHYPCFAKGKLRQAWSYTCPSSRNSFELSSSQTTSPLLGWSPTHIVPYTLVIGLTLRFTARFPVFFPMSLCVSLPCNI